MMVLVSSAGPLAAASFVVSSVGGGTGSALASTAGPLAAICKKDDVVPSAGPLAVVASSAVAATGESLESLAGPLAATLDAGADVDGMPLFSLKCLPFSARKFVLSTPSKSLITRTSLVASSDLHALDVAQAVAMAWLGTLVDAPLKKAHRCSAVNGASPSAKVVVWVSRKMAWLEVGREDWRDKSRRKNRGRVPPATGSKSAKPAIQDGIEDRCEACEFFL